MINKVKLLSVFTAFFVLLSCSSSDDGASSGNNTNPGGSNNTAYTLKQSITNIQELDNVTFSIFAESNEALYGINAVDWFIDDQLIPTGMALDYRFTSSGTHTVRADFKHISGSGVITQHTVEKTVTVAPRPKYVVTLKKVEILSYSGDYAFTYDIYGYYMRNKFEIREMDSDNNYMIKYMSAVNDSNFDGGAMNYPISWDISAANYKMNVYKTGDYYTGPQNFHSDLLFYFGKRVGNGYGPWETGDHYRLDLNPYREVRPTTIETTYNGLELRFTLAWN